MARQGAGHLQHVVRAAHGVVPGDAVDVLVEEAGHKVAANAQHVALQALADRGNAAVPDLDVRIQKAPSRSTRAPRRTKVSLFITYPPYA